MKKKERILIIDDELDFVEAFRMTMEGKSYKVTTASSKAQAQDLMKVRPDCIVLGTLTPAGEAFAMHQWLNKNLRYHDIPLLVIDAKYEERQIRGWRKFEGMQLDADEYVSKPIEPSELVPRIRTILDEATRMIKVLVADDHNMVRAGIGAVLALHKDINVVGEAVDGQDAIDKALRLMPNVVLMDLVMPVMGGLEATKQLSQQAPDTRALIMTQYEEEENMVGAKSMGAWGFIPKRAASSDLVTGVRTVGKGSYFPEAFATIGSN